MIDHLSPADDREVSSGMEEPLTPQKTQELFWRGILIFTYWVFMTQPSCLPARVHPLFQSIAFDAGSPVPAAARPLMVRHDVRRFPCEEDQATYTFEYGVIYPGEFEGRPLDEIPEESKFGISDLHRFGHGCAELAWDDLLEMAQGRQAGMAHPHKGDGLSGRMGLLWWLDGEPCCDGAYSTPAPLFEFIPDAPLPAGIGFSEWLGLRYPNATRSQGTESQKIWFYKTWIAGTAPDSGHPSHEEVLERAVVDNMENLVACALGQIGEIRLRPDRIADIRETALGIAKENAGDFGCGPGFMSACHRNYRDDDFTMAEDQETWIPRARRIEAMLLAAGAVDYSPLLKACEKADLGEVRRLLDAGYPPNFSVYGYATPLTMAIAGSNAVGDTGVVRLLLERGADPNLPRPFFTSMIDGGEVYPLSLALRNPEFTALLLDAGADPTICGDDSDQTPVVFAGGFQTEAAASALFSRVDFGSVRNPRGATGAHLLATADLALCRKFITPEIANARDISGQTPLGWAMSRGDLGKARLLLELGADPRKISAAWHDSSCALETRWVFEGSKFGACNLLLLTPVQAALAGGSFRFLESLLELTGQPESHALKIEWKTGERMIRYSDLEIYGREGAKEQGCGSGVVPPDVLARLEVDSARFPSPGAASGALPRHLPLNREIFGLSEEDTIRMVHVLLHLPDPAARYPEFVVNCDFRAIAEQAGVSAHMLAAFDAGRPLTAMEMLRLAAGQIQVAEKAAEQFAKDLARMPVAEATAAGTGGENNRCKSRELLSAIGSAEESLALAREKIPGMEALKRDLVADICAQASAEFDGGSARARRDANETGKVGIEDFADALRENLSPGSTMDFGKLLQNARKAIALLDEECVKMIRNA